MSSTERVDSCDVSDGSIKVFLNVRTDKFGSIEMETQLSGLVSGFWQLWQLSRDVRKVYKYFLTSELSNLALWSCKTAYSVGASKNTSIWHFILSSHWWVGFDS